MTSSEQHRSIDEILDVVLNPIKAHSYEERKAHAKTALITLIQDIGEELIGENPEEPTKEDGLTYQFGFYLGTLSEKERMRKQLQLIIERLSDNE